MRSQPHQHKWEGVCSYRNLQRNCMCDQQRHFLPGSRPAPGAPSSLRSSLPPRHCWFPPWPAGGAAEAAGQLSFAYRTACRVEEVQERPGVAALPCSHDAPAACQAAGGHVTRLRLLFFVASSSAFNDSFSSSCSSLSVKVLSVLLCSSLRLLGYSTPALINLLDSSPSP